MSFFVVALVAAAAEGQGVAAAQPPNVLFVVGDDVGYSDFGFFNDQKTITPTIDNLLQEGIFLSCKCAEHISTLFHREGAWSFLRVATCRSEPQPLVVVPACSCTRVKSCPPSSTLVPSPSPPPRPAYCFSSQRFWGARRTGLLHVQDMLSEPCSDADGALSVGRRLLRHV